MVREIVRSTNPKIRVPSKAVIKIDKKVKSVIADLKDTLNAQVEPEGVGLAAPQIAKNIRVFVIKPDKKAKVFINPEILSLSDKTGSKDNQGTAGKRKKIMEGCLSLPNFYTPLSRKFSAKVKYLNEDGVEITETFTGIEAQIVQHEVDHLNGKLFIDRMLEQNKKLYEYKNGEWEEVEL